MPDMVLPGGALTEIEACLERLLERSRAVCVLLADISGQLISKKGTTEGLDVAAVSALAASDMAAAAEMARQVGDARPFSDCFHEGDRRHIYVSAVEQNSVLVVIFDEMTQIGLVRIFAKLAVKELSQAAAELEPWLEQASLAVDREFGDALAEGLDEAFI